MLRVLAASHKALGAYDIVHRLSERGRKLAPISVYRIIDVLIEAGLRHRLESRNAYFACLSQHGGAAPMVVLLCEGCNRVAEAEAPAAWGAIRPSPRIAAFPFPQPCSGRANARTAAILLPKPVTARP